VVEGVTSGQIPRPFGSIALVAALLMGVGVAVATSIARANDCLTAPNALTPQGSHWYYRLDRASQRKCWYVRAMPKPAADGASMSVSPSDTTPPSPHAEIHAVRPNAASVSSATTDNTAWSIPEVPGPQASTWSKTSAQAAAPAPAAPVVWPDAPPAVATVKAQEPAAVLTDAPADSASDNDERTARGDDLSNNAGMPMVIFLMLGLGLALVGTLSRDVMKIAAARRERVSAPLGSGAP
jgi:hypothetical protein